MSDLELEMNIPDDENQPTIMLTDEDGTEEAFQVLGFQTYQERDFAVLCPVEIEDEAEVGLVIMESVGGNSLEFVEDEAVTEAVFNLFMETLEASEEE